MIEPNYLKRFYPVSKDLDTFLKHEMVVQYLVQRHRQNLEAVDLVIVRIKLFHFHCYMMIVLLNL